jgi:lipid-binding SYLF domain-containing protein
MITNVRKTREGETMKTRVGMWSMGVCIIATIGVLISFASGIPTAIAADPSEQQVIVDKAVVTVNNFMADPDMTWLRSHIKNAQGVLIVPALVRAGFVFGGSGGRGVLLVRDSATGKWSEPAFYAVGSVSFGLQIGIEASEVIMMVQTRKGLDSLLTSSFKLGADASVAAGPVGTGAAAATADVLSFARAKGAYAGLSLEGAVVSTSNDWNNAYYGKEVRPVDILVTHKVKNPGSAKLRTAVMTAAK